MKFKKIKSIASAPNETIYHLTIKNNHNFFANGLCVHNCDYYNCADNEGEIFVKLTNPERSGKVLEIPHGEAMCQGIFSKVLLTDDDAFTKGPERKGGFGSTSRS